MKRTFTRNSLPALLLALCLLLTGCGQVDTAVNARREDPSATEDRRAPDTSPSGGAADDETPPRDWLEAVFGGEDSASVSDGIPWIDSDLPENVTLSTRADPAEDFHLYAAKDYLASTYIPDGYDTWSQYHDRAVDVNTECYDLLVDSTLTGHDAELIQTLYDLALDWNARNNLGTSPIEDTAARILALDSLDAVNAFLMDDSVKYKVYDFVNLSVSPGINDSSRYVVYVMPGGFFLDDAAEYAKRSEYGEMLYGSIREQFLYLAERMGMPEAEALDRLNSAMALETELASVSLTSADLLSADYLERVNNPMSFEEAAALCTHYPLGDILRTQGALYDGTYIVTEPAYLKKLDTLYNEEHLDAVINNIYVDYLLASSENLDQDAYDACEAIHNEYMGIEGSASYDEYALGAVMDYLATAMQRTYVEKYGSPEAKAQVEDICREVIATYREMLSENDWLSPETKAKAVEKLDAIEIHAGWPEVWLDLSGLSLRGLGYFDALETINDYYIQYTLSLIGTEVDTRNWAAGFDILDCNAAYDPSSNTINMVVGMMGPPFFYEDMPVEELYASMAAFWVGHEISHAFDSLGSQYDAQGNLNNWWTPEDLTEFRRRVARLDDYLDTISPFGGYYVNGASVDTEMIADMTGLQCALRMAGKVDGFDYRRFFTCYGQMNATLRLYSAELYLLFQDEHPLDYLRTNVPVQQFPEFYEAFGVTEDDTMYLAPADRLVIW